MKEAPGVLEALVREIRERVGGLSREDGGHVDRRVRGDPVAGLAVGEDDLAGLYLRTERVDQSWSQLVAVDRVSAKVAGGIDSSRCDKGDGRRRSPNCDQLRPPPVAQDDPEHERHPTPDEGDPGGPGGPGVEGPVRKLVR